MIRAQFLKSLLLLALTPLATAQADCPVTPSGYHTYLGVDVTMPDAPELELLRVQVVWVPPDPDSRFRDQYVIDIDWKKQTHTNVDVWDGELQAISRRNIHPVELASNTNFETGQVHIVTCSPVLESAGPVLVFAYYGLDGLIQPNYTRISPVIGLTAVTNVTVSDAISGSFNNKLDERLIEDVELATGVLPGHYLAQSFLFQSLEPMLPLLQMNPSLFFNLKNAIVKQNRVYITGDDASASVPLSMAGVFSDDVDILDGDHSVRNLEEYIGTVQFQSRFTSKWIGYNMIIEARLDLTVATQPCVDGFTTLTADFTYPSEVWGNIILWSGDLEIIDQSTFPIAQGSSINEKVSCENDYRLTAARSFENRDGVLSNYGVRTYSEPIWVPVATKGTLVRVLYTTRRTGDAWIQNFYVYGLHHITSPSIETVLKVWDVPNIESLYGTHVYKCDEPGDSRVDSIDEIARRRTALLTAEEQASFDPFSDVDFNNLAWADVDGDGSICDEDEYGPDGDRAIIEITLGVYPSDD